MKTGDKVKVLWGCKTGCTGKIEYVLFTEPEGCYKVKFDDSPIGYEYGYYYDDEVELVRG